MGWVMIAFFQLARLYYIFGNAQVQSTTNHIRPYPNWLFILLIALGISIIFYFSAIPWIGLQNSFQDLVDFDCEAWTQRDTIFIFYTAWSTWFIIVLDWIVLCLYFIKLWQILKGMGWTAPPDDERFDPKTKMVFDRIRPILIKIVSLTVMYQIAAIAMGLIRAYAEYDGNEYGLLIVHCSNATERVVFALTVVLMIEHNDKWYQRLIRKLQCRCWRSKEEPLPLRDAIGGDGPKLRRVPNAEDEDEEETNVPNEQDETSVLSSTEFPILSIQSAPKPIHDLKMRY